MFRSSPDSDIELSDFFDPINQKLEAKLKEHFEHARLYRNPLSDNAIASVLLEVDNFLNSQRDDDSSEQNIIKVVKAILPYAEMDSPRYPRLQDYFRSLAQRFTKLKNSHIDNEIFIMEVYGKIGLWREIKNKCYMLKYKIGNSSVALKEVTSRLNRVREIERFNLRTDSPTPACGARHKCTIL